VNKYHITTGSRAGSSVDITEAVETRDVNDIRYVTLAPELAPAGAPEGAPAGAHYLENREGRIENSSSTASPFSALSLKAQPQDLSLGVPADWWAGLEALVGSHGKADVCAAIAYALQDEFWKPKLKGSANIVKNWKTLWGQYQQYLSGGQKLAKPRRAKGKVMNLPGRGSSRALDYAPKEI
jgi:hypothetical protein